MKYCNGYLTLNQVKCPFMAMAASCYLIQSSGSLLETGDLNNKKKRMRFETTPRRCIHNSDISESILRQLHPWNIVNLQGTLHLSTHWHVFWPPDLDLWPRDLDLQTWPRYHSPWPTCRNSSPYVCPFGRESGNTHTDDVKTITPDTSETWGVKIKNFLNILEGGRREGGNMEKVMNEYEKLQVSEK